MLFPSIQLFVSAHPIPHTMPHTHTLLPDLQSQKDDSQSMQHLLGSLLYGAAESRLRSARDIRRLTKTSAKSRAYFGAAGVIIPLVYMLKSTSVEFKEAALMALVNLSIGNERNKVRTVKAGAIVPLLELLQSEDANLKEAAAAAVLTLSSSNVNKPVIGASGITPLLVEILTSGSLQGKVDAVMALFNLSTCPDNLLAVLEAGAVSPLIFLLKDCKKSSKVAARITAILEALMKFEKGRSTVVDVEGGLLALVEVLEEGSPFGREHAVGALLLMCQSNRCRYRDAILQEGVIPGLLELTVQGTLQAQQNARKLLELLRDSPKSQRSSSSSESASAMLESIVYDIAAHVDSGGPGTEAAKIMLTEMVQLSMEESTRHLSRKDSF